ncbi:Sperm-tail PG-rich repeat-containing protein 2 [Thoreauomyces humboldtii]|nr:Sperm-tail PG-rich repeat-containing protein 2 [Thoreauomyces humboldtii]
MYSRSQRKFMAPDGDRANPRLGPGCYTADAPALISGKLHGDEGYAPFASLTPRSSYFDSTVTRGPAPGAYAVEQLRPALHSPHKAPEFGMSKVARFGVLLNRNPGPGTYRPPDPVRRTRSPHREPLELGSRTHPLTRQPGRGPSTVNKEGEGKDGQEDGDEVVVERRGSEPGKPTVHGRAAGGAGRTKVKRKSRSAAGSEGGRSKIVWRRKHGAPSIPPTRRAFGFQENADGDLVPRKPPKTSEDPGPAYNPHTSFASRSQYEHRGPTFMHSGEDTAERLTFRTLDTPAPGMYETADVRSYYAASGGTGNEAALMTLAPCVRLTDAILKDSKKKNVPGPGAYEIKTPIQENMERPRGRILFASAGGHVHPSEYLTTEQARTPGPGAYHPESAEAPKTPIGRPQPFGSTTTRFNDPAGHRSKSQPAPGSYEIEEMDSLSRRVQKKIQRPQPGAFGSISERFPPPKMNLDPGPGTYDPDTYENPSPDSTTLPSTPASPHHHAPTSRPSRSGGTPPRPPTRITKLTGQGPAHFALGNLLVNPVKAHAPVFGTQTERFADGSTRPDLPPPGAYEVASAYDNGKVRFRVPKTAGMISGTPREVFTVKERLPGPGQYEPLILEKRDIRRGNGVSTEPRFKSATNTVPGPGTYLSPNHGSGLLRKTYNITLTEWSRQQIGRANAAAAVAAETRGREGVVA